MILNMPDKTFGVQSVCVCVCVWCVCGVCVLSVFIIVCCFPFHSLVAAAVPASIPSCPGLPSDGTPSGLTLGAGASLMALPGVFPFPPHLAPKDDLTHPEPLDSRGAQESIRAFNL